MSDSQTPRSQALIIDQSDNVATALVDIAPGRHRWATGDGQIDVTVPEPVTAGFKIAIRPIPAGQAVVKYGHTVAIPAGTMVHVHNTRSSVQ